MNWSKFYYDFAAAYGTLWLIMMGIAMLTQSHVNTGMFGLIGFPVIAAIYSYMKNPVESLGVPKVITNTPEQEEIQRLNERIARLEQNQTGT